MNQSQKEISRWASMREVLSQSIGEVEAHPFPEKLNFHWSLAVGHRLAAVSRIDRLSSRTLHVHVANEEWVPVLKGLAKNIIREFNCRTGENLVNRLSFSENRKISYGSQKMLKQEKPDLYSMHSGGGIVRDQLEMIEDNGLREVLRRLECKLRFLPMIAGIFLFGFISSCTTNSDYQVGASSLPRTYFVKKVVYKPASVRLVSSKKNLVAGFPLKQESYTDEEIWQIAAKRIHGRSEKYLKRVLAIHQNQQPPERKDPQAYYNFLLALKAERDGDFDAAVDYYRRVLAHDPSAEEFYYKLAHLYLHDGNLNQVIAVCQNGLSRFPKNADLLLTLAEVLSSRGQSQEALPYLEKVSSKRHDVKALLLSGNIHSQSKDYEQAEKALTEATLIDPANPLGYHLLGRNYALKKQYPEAEKNLRKALNLRPGSRNSRILLAWVMESSGNLQQAEDEYKILIKLDPGNREIEEKLKQLSLANNPEQGDQPVSGNAGPLPEDSSLHLKVGMIFFEQARYTEALGELRLALAETEKKSVHLMIARIYEIFGNYSKAVDELKVLLKQEPKSVNTLLQIARMHHFNKNTDEAINVLQVAARLQPDDDQIYHSLSLAYLAQNQQQKAIDFIRKALELDNTKAAYYYELGALLEQVGKVSEAIDSMQEVLKLNPRNPNAHNFIGYLYALQGEKLDKAIDHLEKALAVQPQNGYFLDSLGWIYFQKGDSERALVEMKKALIYISPDPVIYDHLGDIYFDLENYNEASKAWKIGLSLTSKKDQEPFNAELPDLKALEEKIQKIDNLLKQSF